MIAQVLPVRLRGRGSVSPPFEGQDNVLAFTHIDKSFAVGAQDSVIRVATPASRALQLCIVGSRTEKG